MDSLQRFCSHVQQCENQFSKTFAIFESKIQEHQNCDIYDLENKAIDREKDFNNQVTNMKKVSQDKKIFNADLKEEIETLRAKKKSILKRISLYKEEIAHLQKQEKALNEVPFVDPLQKTKSLELEDALFRKHLGLDVKKVKGGHLQFRFTNISDKNPDRIYHFTLGLDENRKYLVPLMEPTIPDLEELLDKLNSTNDLDKFVHTVRRRFKDITNT